MKMGLSAWRRMLYSVLVLALPCGVATAQFESIARPAGTSPEAGAPGHAAPVHPDAAYPLLQQRGPDWYASPPCDTDPYCAGMPQSAAKRLRGNSAAQTSGFFGGADYLLIRPHFSEAIAFARGTQNLMAGTMNVVEEPLEFEYQNSLRATFGYRSAQGDTELRFTYWYIDTDTSVNGGGLAPGQFIVDPFGNMVGSAFVLNPGDARFDPTFTTPVGMGGESIATTASVRLNVFDLDLGVAVLPQNPSWLIDVRAGVRIAEVDQFYDSVIFDGNGAQLSRGDFTVDFVGAGPRLGGGISRIFGQDGQFSVFSQGSGALLLGQYDLAFSNSVGGFSGSQTQSMTRLIPVVDMEVGGAWQMTDRLTLSAGYLFQAWFDLGVSGGKFDGFFSGTDDANIMSFDGMFARAEVAF